MSCKIGEIDFPTKLGKCDIIIPDSDSSIAHFVLKNDDVEIKIKTFESEYYGKNDYILNAEEKEVLNTFLDETNILGPEPWQQCWTYWETIAIMWDEVNENSNYPQRDQVISKELRKPL